MHTSPLYLLSHAIGCCVCADGLVLQSACLLACAEPLAEPSSLVNDPAFACTQACAHLLAPFRLLRCCTHRSHAAVRLDCLHALRAVVPELSSSDHAPAQAFTQFSAHLPALFCLLSVHNLT
jgi:hypothetical protein